MKKIIMVMAAIALFAACKKSDNSTPSNSNGTNTGSYPNTITILDDGKTYSFNGYDGDITCLIDTGYNNRTPEVNLEISETDSHMIDMRVNAFGYDLNGAKGIGTYKVPAQTLAFSEHFTDYHGYGIDSGSVTITSLEGSGKTEAAKGIFTLWLSGTTNKKVTGVIDCKAAQISN